MDGFAGGMTLVGFGFLGALGLAGGAAGLGVLALIVAAAAAGFLTFNYPPARIFMSKLAGEGGTPLERGAALAVFLASADSDGITGRLLSAPWDPWEALQQHRGDLDASDIYTLRRIVPKDRGKGWGNR